MEDEGAPTAGSAAAEEARAGVGSDDREETEGAGVEVTRLTMSCF